MTTIQKLIEHLSTYPKDAVVAYALWGADDVIQRASERGLLCSKEQAEEIIDRVDRKQDASLGISWATLDCYIDEANLQPLKTVNDYLYCETCEEFVDLWKYGSVADAGHEGCKTRPVTEEELKNCIQDCIEDGCFEEE